jgi:hypothetical protein
MLLKIALVCAAPVAVLGLGYLAACAGGQRWLTLREWWGVTKHVHGAASTEPYQHCEAHGLAHPCEACAVESQCHPAMQEALTALEHAHAGLKWYGDRFPEVADGSDDEAAEMIGNAMQALRDALGVGEVGRG